MFTGILRCKHVYKTKFAFGSKLYKVNLVQLKIYKLQVTDFKDNR
jgi:hypothetical protein